MAAPPEWNAKLGQKFGSFTALCGSAFLRADNVPKNAE
jgi:hypothetical protein